MVVFNKIPVTVLTGYLGAGKTTLLNHILTSNHGQKIAVIVNEFGEIGIDHQLIVDTDEEIFEMNNGCICCTVRGDLIRMIGKLLDRREQFDILLIETTGLADPAPVIQSFFVDELLYAQTELDAVVTVVDAKHIWDHWDSSEAQEQIAFADVVILNKIDLVSPAILDELEKRVRSMNAMAKIKRTQNCEIGLDSLLGLKAFNLKQALSIDPQFLTEDAHLHDSSITSIGITSTESFCSEKVNRWLYQLAQNRGSDIFRMKGIVNLDDEHRRFVFQGVHMTLDGRPGKPWGQGEVRQTELIFIGRNLDEQQIKAEFYECRRETSLEAVGYLG